MLVLPGPLRNQIKAAFKGVTLGDGVGLRQARAMDDYQDEKEQLKARIPDEKEYWESIPDKDLVYYNISLCFFDADGMRFHLPAYMLSDKERDSHDSLIFHLTHLDDYGKSKFISLNNRQRVAVRDYLLWCKRQEYYAFESQEIESSIVEYWNEN